MLAQILPTPLTRLRWWRVCLDEAQMVENTTAKAAALAVEIQAQHRCAAVPYLQPSCGQACVPLFFSCQQRRLALAVDMRICDALRCPTPQVVHHGNAIKGKSIVMHSAVPRPRWCITGTPLSRGLEDLYGLFFFLHARPWADARWWRDALERPYLEGQPDGVCPLAMLSHPAKHSAACGAITVLGTCLCA